MKYICKCFLVLFLATTINAFDNKIVGQNILSVRTETEVVESNPCRTILKFVIPENVGTSDKLGLPVISRMIAVPRGCEAKIRIIKLDSLILDNVRANGRSPLPAQNDIVRLETQGIMRDYQVAQLLIYPIRTDSQRKRPHIYKEIVVELEYVGGQPSASKSSMAFEPIYQNLLLNYKSPESKSTPGGYLIIVPDEFYDEIQPLANWKQLKGWKTTVSKLSEVGNNPEQIKTYIQNAYETWDPCPEYVLLVGDVDRIDAFVYPYTATDHPYSLVDGDDYLSDILVGRISVSSSAELQVVVSKILGYEKEPYLGETDWYKKALMVAGNYGEGATVTTCTSTKRWARELLLSSGYTQVDTVFYPPIVDGRSLISSAVNDGVALVNFRGWSNYQGWHYPQFYREDVQDLSNGWKLPFITGISCATGNFNLYCFGEAWLRAGTISQPKGGIASYGPSTADTHTKENNCIDYGIYWGILREGISGLAQIAYRGKLELCKNFPLDTIIKNYFYYYNLLGDPELNLWTDVPESLNVQHLEFIGIGTNFFEVRVQTSGSQDLEGALVSLFKEGEIEATGFTDANGFVSLPIAVTIADTMFVTVTAHNYIPYLGTATVTTSNAYVGFERYSINDDVNPNEIIEMGIMLKNHGTDTAYTVKAKLKTSDNFISLIDTLGQWGNIAPDSVSRLGWVSKFSVAPTCTNEHIIYFQLNISSGANNWISKFSIPVYAGDLSYVSHQIVDGGNEILEPGELADLEVRLCNLGGIGVTGVEGILSSNTQAVTIADSEGTFGNISLGDSASNSGNRFKILADSSCAIGREVGFTLFVSGDGGYSDIVCFSIIIGPIDNTAPLGPDGYGYFAYDNTDTKYDEAPSYNWIEIDPKYGGSGTIIPLGNLDTKVLTLPFTFRFYGKDYTRISVCSNGWISMDSTFMTEAYNWSIPSSMGPPTLIAPFWDYLNANPDTSDTLDDGNIVYYADSANHRFIVEWSKVYNMHEIPRVPPFPSEKQTFEVIFLDPAHYSTRTGDGEIIFQYHTIVNDDTCNNYCTVGIEDLTHTNGIEYTFANIYPKSAASLCSGRAIKFTTDFPDTFFAVEETHDSRLTTHNSRLFQNYPNPFTQKTVIEFRVQSSELKDEKLSPSADELNSRLLTLRIHDIAGRLIRTFTIHESRFTNHEITWDGKDDQGRKVQSGIYFYRLSAGDYSRTRKMVKLKNP